MYLFTIFCKEDNNDVIEMDQLGPIVDALDVCVK